MELENKSAGAPKEPSRRKFVRTAVYVAPAILTLTAIPSFASAGSARAPGRPRPRPRKPSNPGPLVRLLEKLAKLFA